MTSTLHHPLLGKRIGSRTVTAVMPGGALAVLRCDCGATNRVSTSTVRRSDCAKACPRCAGLTRTGVLSDMADAIEATFAGIIDFHTHDSVTLARVLAKELAVLHLTVSGGSSKDGKE